MKASTAITLVLGTLGLAAVGVGGVYLWQSRAAPAPAAQPAAANPRPAAAPAAGAQPDWVGASVAVVNGIAAVANALATVDVGF
jgi:uncharacterized iron-regulated membrane protein